MQSDATEGSAVASISIVFPWSNTAGNLIVAFVRMSTTSQSVSVIDSAGNAYTDAVAQFQDTDGHQIHIFYAKNIAGGANTVTAKFSSTNNHPWLAIFEYGGLSKTSPLDQTAHAEGYSSTVGTGTITTNGTELIFAGVAAPATAYSGTFAAGSGYSLEQVDTGTSKGATEDAVASGSRAGTYTLSSSANWSAALASFMAAGTSPTPTPSSAPTPSGAVNPRNYGAVGDGVHDDSAAFKSALAVSNVFVPPGTYLINQTVVVQGRTIQCDPAAHLHTTLHDSNNTAIFRVMAPGNSNVNHCDLSGSNDPVHPAFTLSEQANTLLQDWCWGSNCSATFDSNTLSGTWANAAISVYGNDSTGPVDGATITNNIFTGCAIYGVALVSSTNALVANNDLTACALGSEADDLGQVNTGNVFRNNSLHLGYGMGYTSYGGMLTFLTCGQTVSGFNYSGNTCDSNRLDLGVQLDEGGGSTPYIATYTNNLCGGLVCSGVEVTHF
jgi:parallel beta-helix repeat protein